MRILIVSADGFEDTELLVPYYRLLEAGAEVDVASLERGRITGKHGYEVEANLAVDEAIPQDYDLLVLPGGKAPAALRDDPRVQAIARAFMQSDRPVAAICHGPQILVSAGLLEGRRATAYKSVAEELRDAGAEYEDREVVVDGNLISSRRPGDLPAFVRQIMQRLTA
ncbi:MAG: type 1 glutamine amidotransferase [Gammaproteobacteria bacterium]|nr:type 1 glutamine amidotransferase [Gammaproteobacteria bacterium]